MFFQKIILPMAVGMSLCACTATKPSYKKKTNQSSAASIVKIDTSRIDTSKTTTKILPFEKVITEKAVTSRGLFKVHKIDEKIYFEIPDSLFERDILTVNRISKAATEARVLKGYMGYAGDLIGNNVIQFCKGPNNKVFIKTISYRERSYDSSENGLYRSVVASNLNPISASFDIRALSPDSSAVVLDMTDYLNSDNEIFFFDNFYKSIYQVKSIQKDKSYIEKVVSFPLNVEIRTVKTYKVAEFDQTWELNTSIVLLPKQQMKPRYYDRRVGYFSTGYVDFDVDPQFVKYTNMITRWRLEPKDEDIEKYLKGQLVVPKSPIVYFIDPSTPKKWVPYLIQGVNDWQKAFEKAGFKNAIFAKEAPQDDSTWSIEDARHNVIVYKPSAIANAQGPHIHDPRTGEILETHINWFHGIMGLLRDWYFIQAGPNDFTAQTMTFNDSLIGQLIRFVAAHEVGHTLGLMHNFGASSTVPVDSLRSKQWVETNGHTPSIMDYARFNYVAQPEDGISQKGLFPRIGVYDEWAIEWGYKWLPQFKTIKDEKFYMNEWIKNTVGEDKRLWFGSESSTIDPRCQSEDLGDDAIKAGNYGIKNLQRVMKNLISWTYEPGEDLDKLADMNNQVVAQFRRYITHVVDNVGGLYMTQKKMEESGNSLAFPERAKQKAAVNFLNEQVFKTPLWLLDTSIFNRGGNPNFYSVFTIQNHALNMLLSNTKLGWISYWELQSPDTYRVSEMLSDLNVGIWTELKTKKGIDIYRRNLQKMYVRRLLLILNPDATMISSTSSEAGFYAVNKINDVHSLIKKELRTIESTIGKALPSYKDQLTILHLQEIRKIIVEALNPKSGIAREEKQSSGTHSINLEQLVNQLNLDTQNSVKPKGGCEMWRKH